MWNFLSLFWGKLANVSLEEKTENLEERWLAVILDLCSSICVIMRRHQFSDVGKSKVHIRALKLLEIFNYMLTLLAMACSNHVNVSGFIWADYCRPTINSTNYVKEKKNVRTN